MDESRSGLPERFRRDAGLAQELWRIRDEDGGRSQEPVQALPATRGCEVDRDAPLG